MKLSAESFLPWDVNNIAAELWKDPEAAISQEMVKKINLASEYLERFGYKIEGVKAGGIVFSISFYKAMLPLPGKYPYWI